MAKYLYTADWHLGKKLYGLDYTEQHFYDAAFSLIDFARSIGVKVIFNAGDLLDTVRPTEETMHVLSKINSYLIAHEMTMYVISGNHDYVGGRHWCEILNTGPEKYGVQRLEQTEYAFIKPKVLEELNKEIECQSNTPLMLHTPIKEFVGGYGAKQDRYLSIKDLASTTGVKNFKHIIIGDTHKTAIVEYEGKVYISPGSIENVYANEDINKYVFVYDTEKETLEQVQLKCPYIKIKTEKSILNEEDLNKFINDIVNNPDFNKIISSKAVIYVWCSASMESLCLETITRTLYGNKDQGIRNNIENPLLVHTIVVATKKKKQTKELDQEMVTDVIIEEEEEAIKSFEDFYGETIKTKHQDSLSDNGKQLLNDLLTKEYDITNLEHSWNRYNANETS